jgi:hypothetical protein
MTPDAYDELNSIREAVDELYNRLIRLPTNMGLILDDRHPLNSARLRLAPIMVELEDYEQHIRRKYQGAS